MPIDPTIALSYQPPKFTMPNVGQTIESANALMQLQQNQQQIKRQNMLQQILSSPGAIDQTGNPTPDAMQRIMSVDPAVGMKMKQNALVQQEQQLRFNVMKTDLFAKKQDLLDEAYAPLLESYEEAVKSGMTPEQAAAEAQRGMAEANKRLMDGGMFSEMEQRKLPTRFDPTQMRQYLAGSQQIRQWRAGQIAQEKERRAEEKDRRQAELDAEKERRAGWSVMTDPGRKDEAGNPTQFRYNAGTGEATTLDMKPYTPTGAAKVGSATTEYGNPVSVQYTGPDGKPVQTMAVYDKAAGRWLTAQGRQPIEGEVTPVKVPPPGSNAALQAAIADDVKNDPAFKDKSAGAQAEEVKHRMAVASGQLSTPDAQQNMAEMIATYQIAPLQGWSLTRPEGQAVMGLVRKINPDYQATEFNNYNKTIAAFGSGKQGDVIRYINNAVQHLDVMQEAADALKNGDVGLFNRIAARIGQEFGVPAPTTFNGLKQIVGTEVERAATGGVGAAIDRDRIMEALDRTRSPEQFKDIRERFQQLFGGQVASLKAQYESGTPDSPLFRGNGKFSFDNRLLPATRRELGAVTTSDKKPDKLPAAKRDEGVAGPPAAAVADLKANPTPERQKQFDAVFGAGAAGKALGQSEKPEAAKPATQPELRADPAVLDQARAAIAKGAPRDKVIERLRQNGIDPAGL